MAPTPFLINFQVLDMPSNFNFLLGRPWIRVVGVVPSSLHQQVKFVVAGKVVMVHEEIDFRTYNQSAIPYVEPSRVDEPTYYSLDLVAMIHVPVGTKIRSLEISKSSIMSGKMLLQYGYKPRTGLGKETQGIKEPIKAMIG